MTQEEINQQLYKEVAELKDKLDRFLDIYYRIHSIDKDIFPNPVYFNGLSFLNGNATIKNLLSLQATGGTAPIADGNHTIGIPEGGGDITIQTKNGIITQIT